MSLYKNATPSRVIYILPPRAEWEYAVLLSTIVQLTMAFITHRSYRLTHAHDVVLKYLYAVRSTEALDEPCNYEFRDDGRRTIDPQLTCIVCFVLCFPCEKKRTLATLPPRRHLCQPRRRLVWRCLRRLDSSTMQRQGVYCTHSHQPLQN